MATITHPEVGAPPAQPRAGDRFTGVGLLLIAGVFAAVQALAGEIIPPLALSAAVYAAFGVVVLRRAPRWLLVTVVVLASIHALSSIPFFSANLAHPESPASFLPDVFVLVVLGAVAAVAIGRVRGRGDGIKRVAGFAAAGLAATATVVSLVAAGQVASAMALPSDVPVEVTGALFPERVEVPAGGAALWMDNRDPIHHTLVIEGTDVRVIMPGSAAVRAEVDLAPGSYRYFCDVPGHERMEGRIDAR